MITEQEFNNIYNLHASKVHRVCLGYASGNTETAKEAMRLAAQKLPILTKFVVRTDYEGA